ncbi:hypothetical protein K402DRAFT_389579 [Aulographum hederae CBS 113979]|uniref:Uncharacterized protein n=1 Tax=Aulographum hederae CBS 113979 TaxID=1176131 RepID=A0A6G1HBQ7_9PEZI|nr:hypothetical protein K402DRAFT_389579 [Aulographum hederae CBS 113979]
MPGISSLSLLAEALLANAHEQQPVLIRLWPAYSRRPDQEPTVSPGRRSPPSLPSTQHPSGCGYYDLPCHAPIAKGFDDRHCMNDM